jgi:hypothetical protein
MARLSRRDAASRSYRDAMDFSFVSDPPAREDDPLGEAPAEDVHTLQRLMVGELIDTDVMLTIARDGKLVELRLVAEELAT